MQQIFYYSIIVPGEALIQASYRAILKEIQLGARSS